MLNFEMHIEVLLDQGSLQVVEEVINVIKILVICKEAFIMLWIVNSTLVLGCTNNTPILGNRKTMHKYYKEKMMKIKSC